MKARIFAAAAISILFSVSVFADQACFEAKNPDAIRITSEDGSELESNRASMWLAPAMGDEQPATLEMLIDAKTGEKIRVFALDFNQTNGREFRVECDGGGLTLDKNEEQGLVANTNYLAGEILNYQGEGCNSVTLKMQQVEFTSKQCQ